MQIPHDAAVNFLARLLEPHADLTNRQLASKLKAGGVDPAAVDVVVALRGDLDALATAVLDEENGAIGPGTDLTTALS